ncbi:hypothetical protein E3E11_06600 [Oecophyllibacter saccharovorans]|uniref:hypothetical protein n=1 Tax=Oecophyllibacter saccharovorans TaxID=2558360 RepID=UPI00114260FF|nr:hypothetical protein [Oecophyllibacter saccharovorans]QDH15574.1 hypothetical protein E3E11_06600 [Oecophyllibacter saccharovorans]
MADINGNLLTTPLSGFQATAGQPIDLFGMEKNLNAIQAQKIANRSAQDDYDTKALLNENSRQNTQIATRAAQADYEARMARGRALQQATGRNGVTDYALARATIAADPRATYGAEEGFENQNRLRSEDLANQEARKNVVGSILSSVGMHPDALHLAHAAHAAQALFPGVDISPYVQQIASHPDGIAGGVKQLVNAMQTPQQQQENVYGTAGRQVDTGGSIVIGTQQSALTDGKFNPRTVIGKTLSPEAATAPVEVTNPDGSKTLRSRADAARADGQGNYLSRPTVPADVLGNGRYGQPSPGLPASPPAGMVEANKAELEASTKAANTLMQAAAGHGDRLGMLNNMTADMHGFDSGAWPELYRRGMKFLNHWDLPADMKGVNSAQAFDKWAPRVAQAQAAALGDGTDAKLASAVPILPNSALPEKTNQRLLHLLMGNEDAIHAKAQAWQKSGLPPAQYRRWNEQFGQTFDPRAFQVRHMTPDERRDLLKELEKDRQLDEFRRKYNAMGKAGMFDAH